MSNKVIVELTLGIKESAEYEAEKITIHCSLNEENKMVGPANGLHVTGENPNEPESCGFEIGETDGTFDYGLEVHSSERFLESMIRDREILVGSTIPIEDNTPGKEGQFHTYLVSRVTSS